MNTRLPDDHQPQAPADKSVRVTRRIPFRSYNQYAPVQCTRRNVPHWTQPGATYFITFRLGDSLPLHVRKQWEEEREVWFRFHPEPWSDEAQAEYRERFDEREEEWLNRGLGECHLRNPDIRAAVEKHLLHSDDKRYDVDAFVLMPNHVHALLRPHEGPDLFELLQGIKGTSSRTCNKLLGRTGTLWMEDSYNRIVRDAEELFAFRRYIAANPMKAKLTNDEFTLALNDVLYVEP
jgi:REP element-mobilizing transposase RayT